MGETGIEEAIRGSEFFGKDPRLTERLGWWADKWTRAFPKVDVEQELRKMDLYLHSSGKRYRLYSKFIFNWLSRVTPTNGADEHRDRLRRLL